MGREEGLNVGDKGGKRGDGVVKRRSIIRRRRRGRSGKARGSGLRNWEYKHLPLRRLKH